MSGIVRAGGLNILDDAVKIKDLGVSRPIKIKEPSAPAEGEGFEEAAFEGGALDDMAAAETGEAPAQGVVVTGQSAGVREEIIQSAMSEAGRILEDAVIKAEQTRMEQLAALQQEADELRRRAAEEGRAEGREAVLDEMKRAANELEGAVARFEGDRAGFETEYENQLKWMAIEIASKVLAKKVADDAAEMAEMVQKAVQSVKNEPWIRIEVAGDMTRLIDKLTAMYAEQANVEVGAIPAEPGTVQIETPSGMVDASLATQLANLREYFAQNGS